MRAGPTPVVIAVEKAGGVEFGIEPPELHDDARRHHRQGRGCNLGARRARQSTFWAAASAVSFVVAILLVAAVGLGLVFPSRNPEPWALLTAISLAVCAYVIFVIFFLWGAMIRASHRPRMSSGGSMLTSGAP